LASEWKGVYQEVSVNWRVVKNGEQITPDSVVISFNGETKNVTPTSGSGTVKFTVTSPGSRNGVVTALAGGKNVGESPKSFSHTVYLPTYWGFSTVESAVGLDFGDMNNGGRSLNGTKTFTNDSNDKYLWLCVPEGNTITKVTSSGFDVIMNAPEEASTEYGKYKCYRSADLPGAGSITVTIA